MRPLPIRWKIAAWSAAVTGGTLLVFAAGTLVDLYHDQLETIDAFIAAEAQHLAEVPAGETRYGPWIESADNPQVLLAYTSGTEDGAHKDGASRLPVAVTTRTFASTRAKTVRGRDDHWRVQTFHRGSRLLLVAYELSELEDTILDLLTAYLMALPFGTAFAALGAWIVAGRALAPVRVATDAAARIGATALDHRLPAAVVDDEIGRLTTVLNQMLGRLEAAFLQANRFTADASHELRTPLTIMRGEIDALLSGSDLTTSVEVRLLSLQEEIARLNRITEHLLLLARFDTGRGLPARQALDFSALVAEACEDAGFLADARDIRLTTDLTTGIVLQGDPGQLRRLLLNLLDNAAKFNVPGGRLHCRLEASAGTARLVIGNTGPGIPSELRPRVFERFFRTDAAREQGGHGLGLSLCREIVRAHGGEIALAPPSAENLTEFVVTLPHDEGAAPP